MSNNISVFKENWLLREKLSGEHFLSLSLVKILFKICLLFSISPLSITYHECILDNAYLSTAHTVNAIYYKINNEIKSLVCFYVSFTAKIPITGSAQTLKLYYMTFCICDLPFENLIFTESIFFCNLEIITLGQGLQNFKQ